VLYQTWIDRSGSLVTAVIDRFYILSKIRITNPVTDALLETPRSTCWKSDSKNDLLKVGKPIPIRSALAPDKKPSKVFCRALNPKLYEQHSWTQWRREHFSFVRQKQF